MRVEVKFNFRVVESNTSEFTEVFPASIAHPQETQSEESAIEVPLTPVLPIGSSTIAPGLTMAVGS